MLTEVEKKKPYLSKTLIANLLVGIIAMAGPEWVAKIPKEQIVIALSLMNMILRLVTKDKIGLS